jgi:hypothetical protein
MSIISLFQGTPNLITNNDNSRVMTVTQNISLYGAYSGNTNVLITQIQIPYNSNANVADPIDSPNWKTLMAYYALTPFSGTVATANTVITTSPLPSYLVPTPSLLPLIFRNVAVTDNTISYVGSITINADRTLTIGKAATQADNIPFDGVTFGITGAGNPISVGYAVFGVVN